MLARKSLLIYASNVLGALLGAGSLYFVGRYIPPEAVGMVAVGLSLANFAAVVANLNFDAAHIKRVSEGQPLGDCVRTYATIRLALTAVAVAGLVIAAWAWNHWRGFADATTLPVLLALALYLALLGVRAIPADTFFGLQQIAKVQVINVVDMFAKAFFTILACMVVAHYGTGGTSFAWLHPLLPHHAPLTTPGAGLLFALVVPATAVASTFAAYALSFEQWKAGVFRKDLARSYARFALPLAVLAPLGVMSGEVDTLMLGYFWSSTDAGYYYAAKRIVVLVGVVPAAIVTIFFPMISRLAAMRDEEAVGHVFSTTMRNMSLVLALLTMFLVVFAGSGLEVFLSATFAPAAPTLQWLALATFAGAIYGVYYAVVQGYDRPWDCTRASLVLVVGNIVLNAIFIPDSILGVPLLGLKGPGAALATTLATALALGFLVLRQPQHTRGRFPMRSVVRHVLAATATGLALAWSQPWPLLGMADRFYDLALAGAIGTALYALLLLGVRELGVKDWILIRDVLHLGKMKDYIVGELRKP